MGRVAAAIVAALSLAPRVSVAQRAMPSHVRVESTPCEAGPFDVRVWTPLLRNELETDGVASVDVGAQPAAGETPLAVIHVELARCDDRSTEAAVTVDDELTHKTVRRVVALDDIPAEGRARALALAIAELLRASWIELALDDAQAPQTVASAPIRRAMLLRVRALPAPTPEPAARVARPPAPPTRAAPAWLGVVADLRTFPGQGGALLGARALFSWSPWANVPVRLRADLGGATGTALAARGEVDLSLASVGLGVMVGGGNERVDLAVGARLEGGWAWASGTPANASTVGDRGSDAVLLATVTSALRVALTGRWSASVDVSAGQTLRYVTVSAGDERVAGVRGPVLAVGLGISAALP